MIHLKDKKCIMFDVDNTLIFSSLSHPNINLSQVISIGGVDWYIHTNQINYLKEAHARGFVVGVWSQGGSTWCKAVVESLEIEDFVDIVMPKPDWVVDDKKVEKWLGNERRRYINVPS